MATVSLRKTVDFYRKQLDSFNIDTTTDQLDSLKGLPFYDWRTIKDFCTVFRANSEQTDFQSYHRLITKEWSSNAIIRL